MDLKEIQNLSYTNEYINFSFKGTAREANRLRRIFLTQIPSMAIDTVNIRCNNTIMTDNILIERLRLIPVLADAKLLEKKEYKLSIKGKGEDLFSNDIQGELKAYPDIIIVKMKNEDQFIADMICRYNTAEKDPVWSVVAGIKFRQVEDELFEMKIRTNGVYTPERLFELAMEEYNK